mgnify:CR=1 FL=1
MACYVASLRSGEKFTSEQAYNAAFKYFQNTYVSIEKINEYMDKHAFVGRLDKNTFFRKPTVTILESEYDRLLEIEQQFYSR